MPLNPTDVHSAYAGMGTDIPASELPKNLCQSAIGFVGGRNGKLSLAPLIKRLTESLGITIYGTAIWQSEAGVGDRLLLVSATNVYSVLLSSNTLSAVPWKQDERLDGPHSYYDLTTLTDLGAHGVGSSVSNGVTSIQYAPTGELIISIGGTLFRYYVETDGTGTERLYYLTIPLATIAAPTLSQTTGGSLTPSQTYYYEITVEDELGRETSPSPSASITLSSSNNRVGIAQPQTFTGGSFNAVTYWNIYRLNPGQTSYRFVAQVAIGTTSYNDDFADSVINARDAAPDDGENDPPLSSAATPYTAGQATMFAVWKSRLVINSSNDPNLVQVSNAGNPVQFSSLPLPTNLDDGLRIPVGGHGQNQVTGLANLGSLLCVFGRDTTSLLYGDDISDFTLRETLQRGCQNPNSIQRCENEVLFLSDDGVYAIGYESGYSVAKRSVPIDDLFRGFQWIKNESEPTSKWRYQASQVINAIQASVCSFYSDNRYYLSMYNRTLAMDIRTGGWTDTGWGAIKTASIYFSQQVNISSTWAIGNLASSPETVFLTFGDPTTYATELSYFTTSDTPGDRDAPVSVTATLVMRPVGAEENVDVRKKRIAWLSQMGESDAKRGDVIGTCTWTVNGVDLPTHSIYAYLTSKRSNALFELNGPIVGGEEIFATLQFTGVKRLELQTSIFELVYLN